MRSRRIELGSKIPIKEGETGTVVAVIYTENIVDFARVALKGGKVITIRNSE